MIATAAAPRRSRGRWIVVAVVALLLLYVASPYYAFWRFTVALRAHDAAALEQQVDFPSVRKSMKQQLNASIAALRPQNPKRQKLFDTLSAALGSSVLDSIVDAYLTPEGLASFLADPKRAKEIAAGRAALPPSGAPAVASEPGSSPGLLDRRIDWSRVRYAFFTCPRNFLVDVDGTKLRFRFQGLRWQLRELQLDLSDVRI